MKPTVPTATMFLACMLLAACSSGPVRRVSEPGVNIQQLTVRADGRWTVDVRIDNFSNVPMRFDRASLAMTVGGQSAGRSRQSAGRRASHWNAGCAVACSSIQAR